MLRATLAQQKGGISRDMRNQKIEDELTRQGFVFEFVKDYPLAQIDMKEAEENPARLAAKLDEDAVIAYWMAMEEGADWEAIMVRDRGTPLDQLINGRHSIAAAGHCKPKRTTLDAYRIREADEVRVDVLIRTANIHNGRTPSTAEKLLHIAEERRQHPHLTVKELSVRFRIRRERIAEYLAVIEAEKRATKVGIGHVVHGNRHFGAELKKALNSLQSDAVFLHAAKLIAVHPLDLRGDAGLDLISSLRGAGTERQAMKIIEAREGELARAAEDRSVKKTRSPSSRATKFMGEVRRVIRRYPGSVEKLYLAGLGSWRQLRREAKVLDEAIGFQEDVRDAMIAMADEMERAEEWAQRRPGRPSSEPTSPDQS